MLDWLKKHKAFVTIVSIFVFIGIPFIIHILYKIPSPSPFWASEWSAGELLSYYGSVLAFAGTVVLGALALHQNGIIKKESDARNKLLEQREHESNMPKFAVIKDGSGGFFSQLRFHLLNVSENIANDIEIYGVEILKPSHNIFWNTNDTYKYISIPSNSHVAVELKNPDIRENGCIFSMKMCCTDKFKVKHKYTIIGICGNANSSSVTFTISEQT